LTLRKQINIDYKKIKEFDNAPELGNIIDSLYQELDVITETQLLKEIDNPPEVLKPEVFAALEGYSIIRVVATIEQFFRNLVKKLVDNQPKLADLVVSDASVPIKSITLGEAVATTFQFQDPNDINKVISKILEIDFFAKMKEHLKLKPDSNAGNIYARDHLLKNWNDLHKVFELRHQLAHTLNSQITTHRGYLRGLLYSAEVFLYLSLAMAAASENVRQKNVLPSNYEKEFDAELELILKPDI